MARFPQTITLTNDEAIEILGALLAQTLLGHQRPETTARYVRPNRQAVADAVRRLDWGMPDAA